MELQSFKNCLKSSFKKLRQVNVIWPTNHQLIPPRMFPTWLVSHFLAQPPLSLHTLLKLHHSSSHTLKSTLRGGFNIWVTCPVSHTIHWTFNYLTANRHTAPDLSHLDTGLPSGASLYPAGTAPWDSLRWVLSEPPVGVDSISNISFSSWGRRKSFRLFPVDLHAIAKALCACVCVCGCHGCTLHVSIGYIWVTEHTCH